MNDEGSGQRAICEYLAYNRRLLLSVQTVLLDGHPEPTAVMEADIRRDQWYRDSLFWICLTKPQFAWVCEKYGVEVIS